MIFLCLCYVFIMYVILLGYLVYSEFQTWPWCHPNFSFEYCKVTNPMDLWIFWLGVKWLGRFYIYICIYILAYNFRVGPITFNFYYLLRMIYFHYILSPSGRVFYDAYTHAFGNQFSMHWLQELGAMQRLLWTFIICEKRIQRSSIIR